MGFTHYWSQHHTTAFAAEQWEGLREDARRLMAESPFRVTSTMNDETRIGFNGDEGHGYETFVLERAPMVAERDDVNAQIGLCRRGGTWRFCKTDRHAYDILVCAILAAAADRAPAAIVVTSDGDLSDWERPLTWASEVLGRSIAYPISSSKAPA